jgi:hypothetical protein
LTPAAVTVFPEPYLHSYQPVGPWPDVPAEQAIAEAARQAFPGVKLGGGMYAYFTELNRKRPPIGIYDYVTHTTNPIVHAADDRSVMETLEALRTVTLSTRAMTGNAPYRVGPSSIGCRDNPYGKAPFENPDNSRIPLTRVDPRQRGLFNAAWTLGYIAEMARGGVEVVAMGAPTGPFGFIHRRADHAQPYFDGMTGSAVYPAFHVMAGLADAAGRDLLSAKSSRPDVAVLAYGDASNPTLWLANLTAAPRAVELRNDPPVGEVAILDTRSFERLATDADFLMRARKPFDGKVSLGPYAVAFISSKR